MSLNLVGTLLSGRYRLVELVGHGGMGSVFRALDQDSEQTVAIKLIRAENAQDRQGRERFEREMKLSVGLAHKNLVRVRGTGFDEELGVPFLVMDLMRGVDLRRFLEERGPLSPLAAAAIGLQVLEGLSFLHQKNLVHRDIKPANLFLEELGTEVRAVLCDLGIAKQVEQDEVDPTLTSTDSVVGSVKYMPPEYVQAKVFDVRSDIYSLNAALYEATGGRAVWYGHRSSAEIVAALVRDEAPGLSRHAPWIPREMVRLIHKGLARKPEERFQTCEEMAAALRALGPLSPLVSLEQLRLPEDEQKLVGAATESLLLATATSPRARDRRDRRWLAGVLAVVLVGLGGLGIPRRGIAPDAQVAVRASVTAEGQQLPGAAPEHSASNPEEASASPPEPAVSSAKPNERKEAPRETASSSSSNPLRGRPGTARLKASVASQSTPPEAPPKNETVPPKIDSPKPVYGEGAW